MTRHVAKILLAVAFAAAGGRAQPAPHIGFIYPAGGQQGATVVVSVGGQNLNGASAAIISGGGAKARVIGHEAPLTQREINDLRDEAQRLQDKRAAARADSSKPPFTADDEKRANEIRQLLATRGNRQFTPAIAETVAVEITLPTSAMAGERELRLKTPGGLSNPVVFAVGQLPETTTPVVTSTSLRLVRDRARDTRNPHAAAAEVTLPALINGQILPGEVDRFRFTAQRGQRLTFAVSARALMPYLADAVPGWFQATLAVYDSKGRELAYADDYRFAPDPVLSCEIPADGTYVMEIKDALFRGREDFVYRIAAGELPFITSVFPLGGPTGSRTKVALNGWNLPRHELDIDANDRRPGVVALSVIQDGRFSNPVKFAVGPGPECFGTEPNDSPPEAQRLRPPAIVNGRIDRPGDEDLFRFEGAAGDTLVAEVTARRLGSPLDSVLALLDANGRSLATNDDAEDKGSGLLTHHADSRLVFKLPSDGCYLLRIADAQRQGGPEYGYRLRLGPSQPDFELRVVPSTINVRAGATVPVTVYALRRDGFAGEIRIAAPEAPNGLALSGARIPAGEDAVRFTLTAPAPPRDDLPPLRLVGIATIADAPAMRPVVPADDWMQAFAYHHLVPAQELRVNISGRGTTLRSITRPPLRFPPNGEARLRIATSGLKAARNLSFELQEGPPGVAIHSVRHSGNEAEIRLTCDPAKLKPGSQGNLILQAFGERPPAPNAKPGQRAQRYPLGLVPAIPFEVLKPAAPDS